MTTALPLEKSVDRIPGEAEDKLLESAELGRTGIEDLDLPPLLGGMPPIHLVEIANEEGGFVPSRAGPEFQDTPAAIGIAIIGAEIEELVPLLLPAGSEIGKLRLGEAFELQIVSAAEGVELGNLPLEIDKDPVPQCQAGKRAMLPRDRREPLWLGDHVRVDQLPFEFLELGELRFELVAHRPMEPRSVARALTRGIASAPSRPSRPALRRT